MDFQRFRSVRDFFSLTFLRNIQSFLFDLNQGFSWIKPYIFGAAFRIRELPVSSGTPKDIPTDLDPQEAFRLLSELFILTPKETEVFDKLVNSEESIQEIADGLYLSRRTCQRHIAAIYEKAGVKSRMGLYQLYIEKQRRL